MNIHTHIRSKVLITPLILFSMLMAGIGMVQAQTTYTKYEEKSITDALGVTKKYIYVWSCGPTTFEGINITDNIQVKSQRETSVQTFYEFTIIKPVAKTQEVEACDQYVWKYAAGHSQTFNTPGRYNETKTLTNAVCAMSYDAANQISARPLCMCDSVITLKLNLKKSSTATVTPPPSCDYYYWNVNNKTYYNDTTVTVHATNRVGCDSTVTLTVKVNKSSHNEISHTACNSYTWHGTTYTSTQTPNIRLINAAGCDSIVVLHLTINKSSTYTDVQDKCDTYTWPTNGRTYNISTSTQYRTTNSVGCDSTITLNLIIRKSSSYTVRESIVQNQLVYTYHGHSFNTTGSFHETVVIPNAAGCDSTIDYYLTVFENVSNSVDTTVCQNILETSQGFVWNGIHFHRNGEQQTVSLRTSHGTDSLLSMTVYAYPSYKRTMSAEICDGDSYNFYNESIRTARSNYTNASSRKRTRFGCDSIIELNLVVNPVYNKHLYETICENRPITYCNSTHNSTGNIKCNLTSVKGCDSIVTMHLTVKDTTHSTVEETIVQNRLPYSYANLTFTDTKGTNGQYQIATKTNRQGCDSVVHYKLTVYPNVDTTLDSNVCANAFPISWNGQTFYSGGNKDATAPNIHNADSVIHMRVHSIANPTRTIYDTVVENEMPIRIYGTYITAATNNRQFIRPNPEGCDSFIYYNLYVRENTLTILDTFICENLFPITWHGHYYASPSTQYDTIDGGGIGGVDSITGFRVGTYPTYDTRESRVICNNQTTQFSGHTYNSTTTASFDFESIHGCDSSSTLFLTVNPVTYGDQYDTIVENRLSDRHSTWSYGYHYYYCYERYGECYRDVEGVEHKVVTLYGANRFRCDSLIDYNLFVWRNRDTTLYDTICGAELPYTSHDFTFTTANFGGNPKQGTAQLSRKIYTTHGADSTIYFSLTVRPTWNITENRIECENTMSEPYVWRDTTLDAGSTSQSFTLRRTSMYGCDSIMTLNLSVNNNSSSIYHDTVVENVVRAPGCYNYNNHGVLFCDTRTIIDTIIKTLNEQGCDSTIIYSLYVHPNVTGVDDSVICASSLPFRWNGAVLDTSMLPRGSDMTESHKGVIDIQGTIPAHTGADSVITMTITVNPSYTIARKAEICDDTAYYFFGEPLRINTISRCTMFTTLGCDSTWILNLTVNKTYHDTITNSCYEDEYVFFGGRAYNEIGRHNYTDSLLTLKDCDSIVTLRLTVNRRTYLDSSVCRNTLPVEWNTRVFTDADTKTTNFVTLPRSEDDSIYNELDSMVVMTLRVRDTSSYIEYHESCDSFTWRNGHTFFANEYDDTVKYLNEVDCDSVIHLSLKMYYSHPDTHYHQNCNSYTWVNGTTYDTSTFGPQFLLRTTHNCDSLVTLDLEINYTTYEEWLDSICEGFAYNFRGRVLTEHGAYYDSLLTVKGCDSLTALFLTVLPTPTIELSHSADCELLNHIVTANTDVDYLHWTAYPDDPTLSGQENNSVITVAPTRNTTYTLTADYSEQEMCPSQSIIVLKKVIQPKAVVRVNPEYFTYEDKELRAIDLSKSSPNRRWFINDTYIADDSSTLFYTISTDYDYIRVRLELSSDYCTDSDVVVIPVLKPTLYVPNIFTPGLQTNNRFRVTGTQVVDYEIYIYNRRGQLVYHSTDINETWDGRFNGELCQQGAYVYTIQYRTSIIQHSWQTLTGSLMLVR